MGSRARYHAATLASSPVTKGHAKGHARAEARKRTRQRYGRSQGKPWLKITTGLVGVLLVAILGFSFLTASNGKLSAQDTNYSFGDVPWRGGLVTTTFALTVEGDTTVNDIVST